MEVRVRMRLSIAVWRLSARPFTRESPLAPARRSPPRQLRPTRPQPATPSTAASGFLFWAPSQPSPTAESRNPVSDPWRSLPLLDAIRGGDTNHLTPAPLPPAPRPRASVIVTAPHLRRFPRSAVKRTDDRNSGAARRQRSGVEISSSSRRWAFPAARWPSSGMDWSRARVRESLDFTVPRGNPVRTAIWRSVNPV